MSIWRWQPKMVIIQSVLVCSAWYAGVHRVLQRAGGGKHSGQFCGCLRAAGWTDGLWIPPDYRQQDPTGVSLPETCRRVNITENKERGVESQPAISCHLASCRYITQKSTKLEVAKSKVPTTVTNAVSWRSEGIKYKKNEVFIDVIESINVLVRRIWHHIKKTNSLACKNKSAITSPEATCLVHRWRKRILIKVGVRCSVGQSLNYLSLKLSVVKIVLYVLMVLLRS